MNNFDKMKEIHEQFRKIALNSEYPIYTATQFKPYDSGMVTRITELGQEFILMYDYLDSMSILSITHE